MSESFLSCKFLSGQTIRRGSDRGSSLVTFPMGKTAVQCCYCLQISVCISTNARENLRARESARDLIKENVKR